MSNTIPKAFFAYPSSGQTLKGAIQDATSELNKRGDVNIQTWEDCSSSGKFVIHTICEAIDDADLFFADLTGLNANVMFELGYAIAQDKRIWLIFDNSFTESTKMFNQLKTLTTVGYRSCHNSNHIVSGFYKDKPFTDTENTIFQTAIKHSLKPDGYHSILHLKSKYEDQADIHVSNLLRKRLPNRIIVDDPRESTVQSLTWYGNRVFNCSGVICHFTNPERKGAHLQTARHALVCGMAYGFEKPLLMLAEDNFLSPIDYREFLRLYNNDNNARIAAEHLDEWLPPVEEALKIRQNVTRTSRSTVRLTRDLRNLRFGDYVAENEEENLVEQYFIRTAEYDDAVKGNQTVFVGRKGSGKTANLINLKNELSKQRRNVVCVIKPPRSQMERIVNVLKQSEHLDVKGYAIESLWKFLLLTEIANTAFNNLDNSLFSGLDATEQHFYNFVNSHRELICEDFSIRLEYCIQNLKGAISESLHSGILRQLREELGIFLSKNQRVAILVDNLDTAWEPQNDIEVLSEILWSLLEVAQGLPIELQRRDSRRHSIQISLAIFLRSDIFYEIKKVALEPDKINCSLLKWDDTELLCGVIEKRFLSSDQRNVDPDALWQKHFCSTVNNIPTKEYITEAILKRPRDIIYLVNASVATAINRRHTRVEEKDILDAEKQYSQYALESINVENTLPDVNLEAVGFEFVGMPAILLKSDVVEAIQLAGVLPPEI